MGEPIPNHRRRAGALDYPKRLNWGKKPENKAALKASTAERGFHSAEKRPIIASKRMGIKPELDFRESLVKKIGRAHV